MIILILFEGFEWPFFSVVAPAGKEKNNKKFPRLWHRQSKSITVTKDPLSKKENGIGHGFAAIPARNCLWHTALDIAPQVPAVFLFFFLWRHISSTLWNNTTDRGEWFFSLKNGQNAPYQSVMMAHQPQGLRNLRFFPSFFFKRKTCRSPVMRSQ